MAYGVLFTAGKGNLTSGVLDRIELDTLVTRIRIMIPQDRTLRTNCDAFVVLRTYTASVVSPYAALLVLKLCHRAETLVILL